MTVTPMAQEKLKILFSEMLFMEGVCHYQEFLKLCSVRNHDQLRAERLGGMN